MCTDCATGPGTVIESLYYSCGPGNFWLKGVQQQYACSVCNVANQAFVSISVIAVSQK